MSLLRPPCDEYSGGAPEVATAPHAPTAPYRVTRGAVTPILGAQSEISFRPPAPRMATGAGASSNSGRLHMPVARSVEASA